VDVIAGAAADESSPSPSLRRAVIDRAVAERRPGRPAGLVAASPVDAYHDTAGELARLMATLGPDDWTAAVPAYVDLGWDVGDLAGHLVAVERYFASRLGVGEFVPPEGTETDHVAMSLPTVEAYRGLPPDDAVAAWGEAVGGAEQALAALAPADLDRRVAFHGFDFRLGSLLVSRSFELWIHGDDMRDAIGQPRTVPDAPRLALMTELAVRAVGRVLAVRAVRSGLDQRSVRLVLTGAGGGAWSLGGAAERDQPAGDRPPPDARIVADAEAFCRLAARRLPAEELDAEVAGDRAVAAEVLAAAAVLAA
jgi:uncharacterized protein (TIGR03083 family)